MNFKQAEKEVSENRHILNGLYGLIKSTEKEERVLHIANVAYEHLIKRFTGYLSSSVLEKKMVEISQKHTLGDLPKEYKKNTFLHIFTICFVAGGHTRIVERWMKNSPEEHEHSIVILAPLEEEKSKDYIPQELVDTVKERNGEFIKLSRSIPPIEKALMLRRIASDYEYVVLHLHPDDVIPILAFGNDEFKRPVINFNGGEHHPWAGLCISDMVANYRSAFIDYNKKTRAAKRVELLPIPVSTNLKKLDKLEYRKELNLDTERKLVISMGAPYKYRPIGDLNFQKITEKILNDHDDVDFMLIGPKPEDEYWQELKAKFPDRLKLMGTIPFDSLNKYISCADLYLNSYPVAGGTALIDVVCTEVPVLFLNTPNGLLDYQFGTYSLCENIDELHRKTREILYENKGIDQQLLHNLKKDYFVEGWREHLKNLLEKTPKYHEVYDFEEKYSFSDYEYHLFEITNTLGDTKSRKDRDFDVDFIKPKWRMIFYFYYYLSKFFNYKVKNG